MVRRCRGGSRRRGAGEGWRLVRFGFVVNRFNRGVVFFGLSLSFIIVSFHHGIARFRHLS